MPQVVAAHPADAAPTVRQPRDDALVRERPDGPGRFVADEGPFRRYERTVRDLPDGGVEERVTFRLAGGVLGQVFVPGFRYSLRRRQERAPWWAPPQRLDRRAATVLGLLAPLSLVAGYLGTLISQTATYAADEFDSSTSAQAGALATTRIGVLTAMVLAGLADRLGRRRMLLVAGVAGATLAATGAAAPNLAALTASQTVARGFATAMIVLIAIVSAEEMPAGSRAWAVSLLTMTAGLGAGVCLWVLPVADLDERAWRLLYVLPLLFVPIVLTVHRRLPETRRFARPHVDAPVRGHGRRFWLLATTGALLAVFASPVGQLQNEFLRDARGFSAARVALFTVATATPGGLGIIAGGHLADVRGRRVVAAVGAVGGTALTWLMFVVPGWGMWFWSAIGSVVAGLVVPSYGVYRSELFPTSLRGRLGGVLEGMAVLGSATGLLLVGGLVDAGWSYASAFGVVALAPFVAVVVLLLGFPETAHRELEDINPEDRASPPTATR